MRDQYAGDISDYIKFAFLRRLLLPKQTLGIGWYYLGRHDGRRDGRHREYLAESKWAALDPQLHEILKSINSVAALEQSQIWNCEVVFHREIVPDRRSRSNWSAGMFQRLGKADVVFIDPDNGISRANKILRKSATPVEITKLCASNRPTITIRFPHRSDTHDQQLFELHSLFSEYHPITLRTTVRVPSRDGRTSPRIRWFTLLNGTEAMQEKIRTFGKHLNQIPGASVRIEVLNLAPRRA